MVSNARNFFTDFYEGNLIGKTIKITGSRYIVVYFSAGKANSIVISKTIDMIPAGCSYLER